MAKLVDALALGACGVTLGGSIPLPGTTCLTCIGITGTIDL